MPERSFVPVRVAIVQQPPVFLDRPATLERAAALVAESASQGADDGPADRQRRR